MATFAEAKAASLKYFDGDELATDVYLKKYALINPDTGNVDEPTPDYMHRRLAKEFARIEAKYPNPMDEEEIYQLLEDFKFIVPQGSPMSGIGNPYVITSLGNCVVVPPVFDSIGGISYTDQQLAQLMKRRCGVGENISNLRPKGEKTSNAAKTTDGIGVFMEKFSNTTRGIAQGYRRGALMITLDGQHPEIDTFINIKKDKTKVTGANISVQLHDEFMQAVKDSKDYTYKWPVGSKNPKVTKTAQAKLLWDSIIDSAWTSAEPGVLFWDKILQESPADCYADVGFATTATNPCGEVPLSSDSCRLMVLNLLGFIRNAFTKQAEFDFELFTKYAKKAQRLMDDLVDLELECMDKILAKIKSDPEPDYIKAVELSTWEQLRKSCEEGRRTGLGITALGDTLAQLGIRYGSTESISTAEQIYKTLAVASYSSSVEMAKERGAFPVFQLEKEQNHIFVSRVIGSCDSSTQKDYLKYGRRNIANLTTAPVGSVSILTKSTAGIEPAFLLKYTRRKKVDYEDKTAKVDFVDELGDKWQEYPVYHHEFKHWMDVTGKTDVKESPYYKATSDDVDWVAGVELQAACQRWLDHSISKTINLPSTATKEDVAAVYMRGWESGCKGLTVYRDGSRSGVLIANEDAAKQSGKQISDRAAPKRPASLPADIYHMNVKGEALTVIVGLHSGKPYEVFAGHPIKDLPKHFEHGTIEKVSHGKSKPATYNLIVKNGSEETIEDLGAALDNPTWGSFTRVISTSLRHGILPKYLTEQLLKGEKDSDMRTFSRVMSRVLKNYIEDGTKSSGDKVCGACGQEGLIYQEGCLTCTSCGASKCG